MKQVTLELSLLVSRVLILRKKAGKGTTTDYFHVTTYGNEVARELKNQGFNVENCALWKSSREKFEEDYNHFFDFCNGTIILKDLTKDEYESFENLAYDCSAETLLVMIRKDVIKKSKILD